MSTEKSKLRFFDWEPWQPTARPLAHQIGRVNALYAHREESGEPWWGDGYSLFRGTPPDYLRDAYRSAELPVDAPLGDRTAATITAARDAQGATMIGEPVASYEVNSGTPEPVPVDVFAADAAPELHVDARYVTHARRSFPMCTFWAFRYGLLGDAVVVRDLRGALAGIIQRRPAPDEPRPRRRRRRRGKA